MKFSENETRKKKKEKKEGFSSKLAPMQQHTSIIVVKMQIKNKKDYKQKENISSLKRRQIEPKLNTE